TVPARQGKLIGLMGAHPADAARAMPLLNQLCRRIEHCGPVGAGATIKLALNLPLMVYWQALGEALALCRPLGLDPRRLIDLMSESSGGANVLKIRGPALVKLLKGEDPGPAMFTLDNCVKDLRIMLAEGARCGVEMPLVAGTLACFEEASRHGLGATEGAGLSVYWSNRVSNGCVGWAKAPVVASPIMHDLSRRAHRGADGGYGAILWPQQARPSQAPLPTLRALTRNQSHSSSRRHHVGYACASQHHRG